MNILTPEQEDDMQALTQRIVEVMRRSPCGREARVVAALMAAACDATGHCRREVFIDLAARCADAAAIVTAAVRSEAERG